ncbi:ribosomal-protein-alanine N-acetyltransferase [Methanophagales archaeon]|nr:ribosomal-protein-alanine N-acetyltransferase [Methanophagales archaeon]
MIENMELRVRTARGLEVKIRNFEVADIRKVMEIEVGSSLDGDAGLYLELRDEWPAGFLVAEREGRVVGYIVVILTPEGEGRVFSLAVDSRFRGWGIGRMLLKAAFGVLRKRKIGYVELEVRVSNSIAMGLYNRMGFMEVGFFPYYYKDGEGAILMKKVL